MAGEVNVTDRVVGRLKAGSFGTAMRDDSLTTETWERLKCLVTRATNPLRSDIDWEDTLGVKPDLTCIVLSGRNPRR